jgi:hypothetical protein
MPSNHAALERRRVSFYRAVLLLAFIFGTAAAHAGSAPNCSDPGLNSPAFPVPQFRDAARLWPDNFRPARPGQRLPAERDSTDYTSNGPACFASGHELFQGLDIVGDRLFVLYNVGVQVWDIGGVFADSPRQLTLLDGLRGDWLFSDGHGEADSHLYTIAAIQDPNNPDRVLIAVSGRFPMGVSLFSYLRSANRLEHIYQFQLMESEQVQMQVVDGRVLAFFASPLGAFVLDVSQAAQSGPCLIDKELNPCPHIFLGRIGEPLGLQPRGRYLDVLRLGDSWYLVSSYGGSVPSITPPEIWRFNPSDLEDADRLYRGTERNTHSVTFLRRNDQTFLALRENTQLKIHRIDSCLDGDGCATLPAPVYLESMGSVNWLTSTLTYSESFNTPMLYYGVVGGGVSGGSVERLLDLTSLGGSNQLVEVTAGAETYPDPCNGSAIGYWADYNAKNAYGYRNFLPRQGKFDGASHFYRATVATIDVHIRDAATVLFADGFESGSTVAWTATP